VLHVQENKAVSAC